MARKKPVGEDIVVSIVQAKKEGAPLATVIEAFLAAVSTVYPDKSVKVTVK